MFERFTDRARRVLVLASEEAKALGHNFLGTEHILLGLALESDGVAAKALRSLGVDLDEVREAVRQVSQAGAGDAAEPPPFTPRAKRALELSLREALKLGHKYIGTEHLLLGVLAEGEGGAVRALAKLGVSTEKARAEVLGTLARAQGFASQRPQQPAGGGNRRLQATEEPAAEAPLCGYCGSQLALSARYRDIALQPAEQAGGGGQPALSSPGPPALVRIAYCSTCGVALGSTLSLVGAPFASLRQVPQHRRASRRELRHFPEEAMSATQFEQVPPGRRVELVCTGRRIVEGRVGGSDVQLLGQWAHEGSAEGSWVGEPLTLNWRVEASGATTAPVGELAGKFGERDIEVRANMRLSPGWQFEEADVTGRIGGDDLLASVAPAVGGLGGHTVVVTGALGADEFELFASLSGDHSRAKLRGTVAGFPAWVDGERLEDSSGVRLAGEYGGPPELLALVTGALLYFM